MQFAQELIGIQLSPRQLEAFQIYERELLDWNRLINLTAIKEPEMIRIKHFLDSLTCLLAMQDLQIERLIDVGTGAGFPGIPIKIAIPKIKLTLVESVKKKRDFCAHIVDKLGLTDVNIIWDRAENIGHLDEHRERYDCSVARAVASMAVLAEYLLPLTKVGGIMIAMKGENAPTETYRAEDVIRILGGRIHRILPITLPKVAEQRYLVLVDKIALTPQKYSRRAGIPEKHPLQTFNQYNK